MTDMYPKPPPTTKYSAAFESCWKVHSVGAKKAAWKAGEKAGWTDANWAWLENYLIGRWKDDALWVKGERDWKTGEVKKYVPHLSSFINGERWTDVYQRVKRRHVDRASEEWEQRHQPMTDEQRARAAARLAELKEAGRLH